MPVGQPVLKTVPNTETCINDRGGGGVNVNRQL